MNLQRYQEIRSAVLNEAKNVEDKKRLSYTSGDANVLRNFVSDAEFVGTNQLQNCLTHLMKQVRGISSYVQNPDVEPSETLLSRAADIINYVVLMVANAEDSGRYTGLTNLPLEAQTLKDLNQKSPLFDDRYGYKSLHKHEIPLATNDGSSTFSFVAMSKEDADKAKVLSDLMQFSFYNQELDRMKIAAQTHDYNFGKDDV